MASASTLTNVRNVVVSGKSALIAVSHACEAEIFTLQTGECNRDKHHYYGRNNQKYSILNQPDNGVAQGFIY